MALIELRIRTLAQLQDSLDPAPFHEKALDPRAEEYILGCASDFPANQKLRLLVHAPESLRAHESEVVSAVHTHFDLALQQAERQFRLRMRIGWYSLAIGTLVLVLCLTLRSLLGEQNGHFRAAIAEGLLILGWVALWRPAEVLLYERWEIRHKHQTLAQLAVVPVAFAFFDEASGAA